MKSRLLFLVIMTAVPFCGFSQVDDMYFIPKKSTAKNSGQSVSVTQSQEYDDSADEADAYAYDSDGYDEEVYTDDETMDVDEYNRRYRWNEDYAEEEEAEETDADDLYDTATYVDEGDDYYCSSRIVRFYTPTIGVAVSSPYYWDLYYGPGAYYWDYYWDGWYYYPSSWYWGYYYPYWGWGLSWHFRPHHHYYYGGHGGHGGYYGRGISRPSVRQRERSSLALGSSRASTRSASTRSTLGSRSAGTSTSRSSASTRSYSNRSSSTSATRSTSAGIRSTSAGTRSTFSNSSSSRSTYTPSFRSGSSVTMRSSGSGGSSSRGGGSSRGGRR